MNDLGRWIPEVPVGFMLDHILPQVECDIGAVKQDLTRTKIFVGKPWKKFSKDSANHKTVENTTFAPLEIIFREIGRSAQDGGALKSDSDAATKGQPLPKFTFVNNPNQTPYSERTNGSRPDGYFVREGTDMGRSSRRKSTTKSATSPHHWNDIALPAEYKKCSTPDDIDDNARKILWSMHHIMRSDPFRRFTFGITIENTAMRVWFCCRSAVFVSQPFNFILDHEILIRFVISVTFANEVKLGWDPTIERVVTQDGCVQYKITVHRRKTTETEGEGEENEAKDEIVPTVYLATKILFDSGADALRGRGTRVFEARKLNDRDEEVGEAVAIKDVWVDCNREREGAVCEKLYNAANDEDKTLIEKYFLTVLNHGDVMIGTTADDTRGLIMHNQDVPMDNRFFLPEKTTDPRPNHVTSTGIPLAWDEFSQTRAPPVERHEFSQKIHYRIVFAEVGIPVYKVTTLKDAFHALTDAIAGLQVLHKYHYVHRDISSGNVLVCNGGGKLSDLEHAKKRDATSSHEIRTGTVDFMSVEVESQAYMFRREKTTSAVAKRITNEDSIPAPQFRYNPLHDLESMWWLVVWFVFHHREKGTQSDTALRNAKDQLKHVQQLFPRSVMHHGRFSKFANRNDFKAGISSLPESFREAAEKLEEARRILVGCYERAEEGAEINPAAFDGVQQVIGEIFSEAKDVSGEVELQSLISVLTPPRGSVKRGQEEGASKRRKVQS